MEKALKWILPTLLLTEVALVWLDLLSVRDAVLVVVAVEALLLVVGGRQLFVAARRYRSGRTKGLDAWGAAEDGLAVLLPRRVARLVVKEPRLLLALFCWVFRRTELADGEFGYHRRSALGVLVPLVIVAAPAELLFTHLLVHAFSPWGWVKWALLALGIYAVLWLLGLYASLVTLPHKLEEKGLRLRYGVFVEGFVPYSEIEDATPISHRSPGSKDGLQHAPEEEAFYLASGGKTDTTLRLSAPRTLEGLFRTSGPATAIHVAADDPEGLVSSLRQRIGEGDSIPRTTRSGELLPES